MIQELKKAAQAPTPPDPGVLPSQPAVPPSTQTPGQSPAQPQAQPQRPPVRPLASRSFRPMLIRPSAVRSRSPSRLPTPATSTPCRIQLQFNPAVLQLVNVDAGDLLGRDGQAVAIVHRDEGNGLVTISTSRPPNVAGVNGQGSVATLTFKATAAGDSNLSLVKVGARNSAQANLPAVGSQAVVHVK